MSRCPTTKSLREKLCLSHESAKKVRKILKDGPNDFFRGRWGMHFSHAIGDMMDKVSEAMNSKENHFAFFGYESLYPSRPNIFYINAGETYASTLIYNYETDTARIACIGDIIERL